MSVDHKQRALEALKEGDYPAALNHLTTAIRHDDDDLLLRLARAKCYYLNATARVSPDEVSNQVWKKIEADRVAALEIDDNNYEALYLQGLQSLHQDHNYAAAVAQFDQLLKKLLKPPKKYRQCTKPLKIHEAMNEAKAKLAKHEESTLLNRRMPLYGRLTKLLENDYHEQIEAVRRKAVSDEIKQYKLTQLALQYNEDCADLHQMFAKGFGLTPKDKVDVPECFIDVITEEIFHDPVCTPLGHSYERLLLFKHLDQGGSDPYTRGKLTKEMCYDNIELRNAVEQWRHEHDPK